MKRILVVLLVGFSLLSGCATPGSRSGLAKWWVPVDTSYLRVGMTEAQVRQYVRFPDQVNRTVVNGIEREQWVYSGGYKPIYLYLENDVLIGWQK